MPTTIDPARSADIDTPAEIRARFPALARRHAGHPVAYFDGPGGTQVPQVVADAVADYLLHHNANTHWRYPTSEETDRLIAGAREAMADFLGAAPSEIVIELDHHANVAPWRALERERGVTVRSVPLVPGTGELDWTALQEALSART